MLMDHELLAVAEETQVPLLDPVHEMDSEKIPKEITELIEKGFKTLKVKVGSYVEDDLRRVRLIQKVIDGTGVIIRLDANRNFSAEQGISFGSALNPINIMLFEQPCGSDAWEANAAVARASNVPIMIDKSIYPMKYMYKTADLNGVEFVKLQLKKFPSMDMLLSGLSHIKAKAMTPVLGDGTSTDIQCWMEACVARVAIDNAGENNSFCKFTQSVSEESLSFHIGNIVLPKGYRPSLDHKVIAAHLVRTEEFHT